MHGLPLADPHGRPVATHVYFVAAAAQRHAAA
jgi:hypothetical protein